MLIANFTFNRSSTRKNIKNLWKTGLSDVTLNAGRIIAGDELTAIGVLISWMTHPVINRRQ